MGLGADSGAIHGLCLGFLLPTIVDLGGGRSEQRVVSAVPHDWQQETIMLNGLMGWMGLSHFTPPHPSMCSPMLADPPSQVLFQCSSSTTWEI